MIYGNSGGNGRQGGNNTIMVGDGGNNTIYGNFGGSGGQGGDNLIIGGAGSDTIYGNFGTTGKGGRNLLVGGGGADTIYVSQQADGAEGGEGSIVITGTTTLDRAGLTGVLSEWTSKKGLSTRIADIEGTHSGGLNGTALLQPGVTVFDDQAIDQVFGDSNWGVEWFWYTLGQDMISRKKNADILTNVI